MATLLSYALTTLADVKESLGIDAGNTTKDNLIIRKINQATEIIEGYCQRRFAETTYTNEEYHGSQIDQLLLRNRPITDTTPIVLQVRDTSLNQGGFTTIDTEEYFVDEPAGLINAIGSFYGRWNRWRVTYSAGYATIPADVAEAAVMLASFLVDNGAAGQAIKKKTEGSRSIEYQQVGNSQGGGESLIDQLGLDEVLDRYREPIISGMR